MDKLPDCVWSPCLASGIDHSLIQATAGQVYRLQSDSMAKDRQWLRQRLCGALGWDEVVVEGVVEAITSAETAKEVEAIVQVALLSPHPKYVY